MWRDDALVLDMLIYARQAMEFNAGVSWERFSADKLLQAATRYTLQVVGEAAFKVTEEYRRAHPEIPWQAITSFRHRMVHDYGRVELPKVWSVVENHLVPLIKALEALVPPDIADAGAGEPQEREPSDGGRGAGTKPEPPIGK